MVELLSARCVVGTLATAGSFGTCSSLGGYDCETCDAGRYLRVDNRAGVQPADRFSPTCEPIEPCRCMNGVARTGTDCSQGPDQPGFIGCLSCNAGFSLALQPGVSYIQWGVEVEEYVCQGSGGVSAPPITCQCRDGMRVGVGCGSGCDCMNGPPVCVGERDVDDADDADDDSGGVGIIVVIVIVVVLAAGAVFWFFASRKRRDNGAKETMETVQTYADNEQKNTTEDMP